MLVPLWVAALHSGCRVGVWWQRFTHYLPFAMDAQHSTRADRAIRHYLGMIGKSIKAQRPTKKPSEMNELDQMMHKSSCLQLVDTLATLIDKVFFTFIPNAIFFY